MAHHIGIIRALVFIALILDFAPGATASLTSSSQFPIPNAVTAGFSFTPTNPSVGQVVTFTGTASGGTSPYTFNWNFGDGGTATGTVVKHIFISLQAFTVSTTVTDSVGGTNSFQNTVYVGSLNNRVNCTPTIVRISDITDNATGNTSFSNSPFSPGITTTVSGGVAKRWLTPGPTPSGWHSPGPSCSFFVEIDGVKRPSTTSEDSSSSYDATNGGGSYSGGSRSDFTFNAFDPKIVSNYGNSCTSSSDPTCYGRIHVEMDHDWQAAGYCGPGTTCDPGAFSSQTTDGVTLIDFQGFVYWDGASCCSAQDHSFSGWELHPLTGWRVHQAPLTVSISSSPSNPASGQTVTFTATVTGGTSPYTYNWDFGDGTTATGSPATHAYATGTFNVHLGVTDTNSATGVASRTVTIGGGSTPDFSISSNPSSLTIQSGSTGTSTINLASINSFSGTISLTTQTTPAGLTASTSPTSVTLSSGGSGSSTLTVSSSTPASYTVTVNATSGSTSHTTTISVTVTAGPDFNLSSAMTSTWLQAGSQTTSTIQLTSLNGFAGTITLSPAVSPAGLTASLSSQTVSLTAGGSASSTLTLSSSNPGNYTITVTGTSGSTTHTTNVKVTGVSSLVASDSAAGPSSLFPTGGAKLIQDAAGKIIAIYVDSSGRIGLAYDNSNPMSPTWSNPVKSATPTSAYSSPAAVLISLTSLRIIAIGGSASGVITDIPVTINRDSQNNITGFIFGTTTMIDSSGLDKYPTAVLAHNGKILLAWGYANATRSEVKTLRWDAVTGWTSLTGSSSQPDIVLVDPTNLEYFVPAIIERTDNNNIYVLANRNPGPPSTIAYNKATWNGSTWSWGVGNLTYETNASDADDDPVILAWDPARSLVVAAYGITGTHSYGVFTVNAQDQKTHNDTPSLAVNGDRGWATLGVHSSTGDYYIFLVSVNTDAGSGPIGYIRLRSGGSWNSTINWLDAATDNQVLALRPPSSSPSLDLLYSEGTSSPAKIKFVRLSPFNPPNFSIAANPTSITIQSGQTAASTLMITSLYGFTGSVSLTTVVAPIGLTVSLSPSLLTLTSGGTANSTLTITSSLVPGSYTVTITATSGSLSHTTTLIVIVQDVGPIITFTASPTSAPTGTPVTLTISATDVDGLVSSLKVIWGDGTVDNLAGTVTSDGHAYTVRGIYTIYVNATDNANLTSKSTPSTITISDRPPIVSLTTSATTAPTGTTITLTISMTDPDGTITTSKVVWGDGAIDTLPGTATSDNHAYTLAGTYTVYVNATDDAGLVTKSALIIEVITDRAPSVTFTVSSTAVPTGTTIMLTITAYDPDGTVASIRVHWGDGQADMLPGNATSDSHSYSTAGSYNIYVNATDNANQTTASSVALETVTDRPPTISVTPSTTNAPTGNPVSLTISGSDPDGTIDKLVVSWGDGSIDILAGQATSDSHTYQQSGSYTIYANATDNSGQTTKSLTIMIIITDRPPTVSFTESSTSVQTGTPVTLTITAIDPDGTIATIRVSWDDGTTDVLSGTSTTDSHSYYTAGSYSLYVNATDNSGLTSQSPLTVISVNDRPPIASFAQSSSQELTLSPINFNATSSYDPDGTIIGYAWNFGDSSTGSGIMASHSYDKAGNYTVVLGVTDNNGQASLAAVQEVILDRPPTASFTNTPQNPLVGQAVSFDASSSSDPDGTVVGVAWNFGDGTTGTGVIAQHSYSVNGTFIASLTVTDDSGNIRTSTAPISVGVDPAPTWQAGSSLNAIHVEAHNVSLTWTMAVDSVQVSTYRLYLNGTLLASLPGSTSNFTVTGLNALSHYMFQVAAGNPSGTFSDGPSTEAFTHIQGDVNLDCKVNITDLVLIAASFATVQGEQGYRTSADLNSDGIINISDLVLAALNFSQSC